MPVGADAEFGSDSRAAGLPPLIITCAITGDHQKSQNLNLPVTLDEQVAAAVEAADAGASIIHIHGRRADDPTQPAKDAARYREINDAIRTAVPCSLVDNTQMTGPIGGSSPFDGQLFAYSAEIIDAKPDVTSLNPGPMTFRGLGTGSSLALVTTFDNTARIAEKLQENGIKPQVFIYHPGHLDVLAELIRRELLATPYFVQLVFGQQSGIAATPESFFYMIRQLPANCVFQVCSLGLASIEFNLLSMLYGGHVRTGMEDSLLFRRDEPTTGNRQLVERVVRFAVDLGRSIATPEQTRQLLGLSTQP